MEHRIGRRKKVNAAVELWQGKIKKGNFELVNIGSGGLFLKGQQAIFSEGETFTIRSDTDSQGVIVDDGLKVMVIHQSSSGIGLMWAGCSNKSFLSRLLNGLNLAA